MRGHVRKKKTRSLVHASYRNSRQQSKWRVLKKDRQTTTSHPPKRHKNQATSRCTSRSAQCAPRRWSCGTWLYFGVCACVCVCVQPFREAKSLREVQQTSKKTFVDDRTEIAREQPTAITRATASATKTKQTGKISNKKKRSLCVCV
jgi:hypothetical protein